MCLLFDPTLSLRASPLQHSPLELLVDVGGSGSGRGRGGVLVETRGREQRTRAEAGHLRDLAR